MIHKDIKITRKNEFFLYNLTSKFIVFNNFLLQKHYQVRCLVALRELQKKQQEIYSLYSSTITSINKVCAELSRAYNNNKQQQDTNNRYISCFYICAYCAYFLNRGVIFG